MIRIMIVAPALAVRAGLRTLLAEDPEVEVVAEAADLSGAANALPDLAPGVDVWVMVEDALPVAEDAAPGEFERLFPDVESSVLLLLEDRGHLARLLPGMTRRAWGVLPLDSSSEELQAAVRALHQGLLVGAPELMGQLLTPPASEGELLAQRTSEALTERELQVLELLAQGLANKQIALQLGISEHTVKFHISSIYTRLGATNRTEAVRLGVRQGLIVL